MGYFIKNMKRRSKRIKAKNIREAHSKAKKLSEKSRLVIYIYDEYDHKKIAGYKGGIKLEPTRCAAKIKPKSHKYLPSNIAKCRRKRVPGKEYCQLHETLLKTKKYPLKKRGLCGYCGKSVEKKAARCPFCQRKVIRRWNPDRCRRCGGYKPSER